MMKVPPISGVLGLDTDPFARGMLKATSIASLFPATVTNFLANPLLGVIGVTKQVTSALTGMFTSTSAAADDMADMAANVGVTVEALSGLSLVAAKSGVAVSEVAEAYKFLGIRAAEAAKGEKSAVAAFDQLGLSATDTFGQIKPLPTLMMEVADALAAMAEGGRRSEAANELLSRGGVRMISTLAQGSQAIREQIDRYERWGAVVTTQAGRTAGVWEDSVGDMSVAWQGLKNRLTEKLQVALLPELERLLGWVDANQHLFSGWIDEAVGGVKSLVAEIKKLVNELMDLKGMMPSPAKAAAGAGFGLAAFGLGAIGAGRLATSLLPKGGLSVVLGAGAAGAAGEIALGGSLNDAKVVGINTGGGALAGMLAGTAMGVGGLATGGLGLLGAAGAFGLSHVSQDLQRELAARRAFIESGGEAKLIERLRSEGPFLPSRESLGAIMPPDVSRIQGAHYAGGDELVGTFKSIVDEGRRMPDILRMLRERLSQFDDELWDLVSRNPTAGAAQPSAGSATTQPSNALRIDSLTVKLDVDLDRAGSELGQRIMTVVRRELAIKEQRFVAGALAARLGGGL